jgi:hypothetical protein
MQLWCDMDDSYSVVWNIQGASKKQGLWYSVNFAL